MAGIGSRCLPMLCWRPDEAAFGITVNFGDALFPLIVERILGRELEIVDRGYASPKFIPGGSFLHGARDGDVLWGVGLRTPDDFDADTRFRHLTVASVRGPLTREFLVSRCDCEIPDVYGDPAILLPRLFPDWQRVPVRGRIGVVPHFRNRHEYPAGSESVAVIWPNQDPRIVVSEILKCELVVAGSLHALIVAEAFGIPARWLNTCTEEPEFKYYDYYQATDRHPRPVKTVREAEALGGEPAPLNIGAERLLASFPLHDICGG